MENTLVTGSTSPPSFFRTDVTSSWPSIDYFSRMNGSSEQPIAPYASPDTSFLAFGAQRDPLYVVVPITIIYLSILLTGTIGNISTCIVIVRNKSMHTATNYYLFSLAVSDLLLLIAGLPVEVYLVWAKYSYVFGEGFCMFRGMAAECSTNASVLTITAFTFERYIAICHPFRSHTMSNLSRAVKLILLIWLVALLAAIPMALQFGLIKYNDNPEIVMCTLKKTLYEHSFEIATILFFVVPMILITVLYAMVGLKLKQSNMMKRDSGRSRSVMDPSGAASAVGSSLTNERNCRHQTGRSSRRVLKMLVAVVVAFFICWAPFHVQRLIAIYGTDADHVTSTSKWMEFLYLLFTYVSGVLYYVSATINPILYNIMSNKFREAFKETLARSCGGSRFSAQQEQRSYSSLSRSQQRGAAGGFGSKTAGTAGTGAVPDSIDCSGNSVRDENLRVSPSVSGQQDNFESLEASDDPSKRTNFNGIERTSRSARKISYNWSARQTDDTILDPSANSNRQTTNEGRIREEQSPADRLEQTGRWQDGSRKLSNNLNKTSKSKRSNSTKNNSSVRCKKNCRQFGIGTIETEVASRKKWWWFFKWLPDRRIFRFGNARRSYSRPADTMVNDIESNREEYSMSSCYGRNVTEQRPV